MKVGLKFGVTALAGMLFCLTVSVSASPAKPLSAADEKLYSSAFEAAEHGRWQRAHSLAGKAKEKMPSVVLDWMEMTRHGNTRSFAEIARFAEAHPDWPYRYSLMRRAEEAMDNRTPDADVVRWFDRHEPLSTEGMMRLIEALMATGQRDRAIPLIGKTWVTGSFGTRQERGFRHRYGEYLSKDDHAARLDHQLWVGSHTQAKRTARLVDRPLHNLAMARIALRSLSGGVDWHIRQVPKALRDDPGLVYERVRWRRIKDRDQDAYDLLKTVPATAPHPEMWWNERAILARRLLTKGHVSEAYQLTKAHGLSEGVRYVEAEWLSGWIALRYLREPKAALEHFQRIDRYVSYPISKARAAYWAGRAAEDADDEAAATEYFRRAARYDTTYYGQLAVARTAGSMSLTPAQAAPTDKEIRQFEADGRVSVLRMLHQIGARHQVQVFLDNLLDDAETPGQYVLVAELGDAIARRDLSVRAARKAHLAGMLLPDFAYPTMKIRDGKPEQALIHAIARQESNFDVQAISPAGARGLMQLMPSTAKAVARQLRIGYSTSRLTTDPDYNILLGRSYLGRLIERFNGSYILAIAAYNAGPTAAARWAREFGDPTEPGADPIDWVEMIPYRETRNYVQRVLENLQVYRLRLEGPLLAEGIVRDLSR